jgi:hypothetical protein
MRAPAARAEGDLLPSTIRERILCDHAVLRRMLSRIEVLARSVLEGRNGFGQELLLQAGALEATLRDHLELEERILVPALLEADAWGPQRVERFHVEHARQREIMDALWRTHPLGERPTLEVALVVWGFARLLRGDMASEERISLNANVLRDDPL